MRRPCRIGAVGYAWAPKGGKRRDSIGERQTQRKKSQRDTRVMTRIVVHARGVSPSRVLRIIGGRHRGRQSAISRRTSRFVRHRIACGKPCSTGCSRASPALACSICFAGSGALGLEAVSRGAAQVTFVEKDRRAADAIETLAHEWQEGGVSVVCADALEWLGSAAPGGPFDIVLLDPPYDADLLIPAAAARRGADARGGCAGLRRTPRARTAVRVCRWPGATFATGVPERSVIICSHHETHRRIPRDLRSDHQRTP